MIGIQQVIKETNKKSKIGSEETTKKVVHAFLETIRQELIEGKNINFKGLFSLKRATTKPQGSKNCNKHEKTLNDYKQINKGKGIAAFAKSVEFRRLVQEAKKCKDCQNKKQQLIKKVKLTNRISFIPSKKNFWEISKINTKKRK